MNQSTSTHTPFNFLTGIEVSDSGLKEQTDGNQSIIDSLVESSKVYRNTEKIISKFFAQKDRTKELLRLFDGVFKEELGFITTILERLNKDFEFDRFKEEAVNNLYIYKENIKLAMNLLLDEKFEHINHQINTNKYPLTDYFNRKPSKNSTTRFRSSLMECINEENEEIAENSCHRGNKSKNELSALETIKKSHIDISEYFSEMDKTIAPTDQKSPRNEIIKSKDTYIRGKDLRNTNKSSDKHLRKDTSLPKSKQTRNSKAIVMSVQYFTNSVKQRFKVTPQLKKKELGLTILKLADKS